MPTSMLSPGLRHEFQYRVPTNRTVPHLYPEASVFAPMPEVFATGFLVGLLEWTCAQLLKPYLDWPNEQTVGTHISISHDAATPPGLVVNSAVELTVVDGRRLEFDVEAHDDVDLIARGTHRRFIINTERFVKKTAEKAEKSNRA
jgi:fluoroacetyl-CoA thioesterase